MLQYIPSKRCVDLTLEGLKACQHWPEHPLAPQEGYIEAIWVHLFNVCDPGVEGDDVQSILCWGGKVAP